MYLLTPLCRSSVWSCRHRCLWRPLDGPAERIHDTGPISFQAGLLLLHAHSGLPVRHRCDRAVLLLNSAPVHSWAHGHPRRPTVRGSEGCFAKGNPIDRRREVQGRQRSEQSKAKSVAKPKQEQVIVTTIARRYNKYCQIEQHRRQLLQAIRHALHARLSLGVLGSVGIQRNLRFFGFLHFFDLVNQFFRCQHIHATTCNGRDQQDHE